MPKKFKGENSKAVVARQRKEEVRQAEKQKKEKEAEDAYWADDDKHIARKQQRKEEAERKRLEALERKKQKEQLYEEELNSLKSAKVSQPAKLSRHQIELERERIAQEEAAARKKAGETEIVNELPLEENINRLDVDNEARTIEEAISVLSTHEKEEDRHPEKRMKAAYAAYEEKNLPILKAENPNMRLSQLKQMLKKNWMKSPENPMVQKILRS